MYKISIPKGAKAIILGLRYENHEAYVVGGCVRDSLLGREPKDWDICTSATPQEVKEHLNRCSVRAIDTGLKHGTVTADMERAGKYEITTFRIDGDYSDNRRPDSVTFTESIYQDLSRRDFTINAMAYNSAGLIDPFHGVDDLKNGIIRCVGNPNDRFGEDALRILRALRFASVYGFSIEKDTAQAIHDNAWRLTNIAAERIHSELCKLLLGNGVLPVLLDYSDVIATIIPEMKPCIGFNQNNKYHQYTIYDHIAHAVSNYTGKDIAVKVALLLHDIGKPCCYTEDENGGHFHGTETIVMTFLKSFWNGCASTPQQNRKCLTLFCTMIPSLNQPQRQFAGGSAKSVSADFLSCWMSGWRISKPMQKVHRSQESSGAWHLAC